MQDWVFRLGLTLKTVAVVAPVIMIVASQGIWLGFLKFSPKIFICLLYTSDAADEEDSVDLGGRRIIKKKYQIETIQCFRHYSEHSTKG